MIRKIVLTILATIGLSYSANKNKNNDICKHDISTFRCVRYISNYDGDTITVEIPNVHPLLGKRISIRVNGVDTPEKRTKNSCEKKQAKKAQRLVENILKHAKSIEITNAERGKYFRIVGNIIADGVSISELLIKHKLAVPYDGGTKKKVNWCMPLNEQ